MFEGDFDEQCKNHIFPLLKEYFSTLVNVKFYYRKVNFVVIGSKGVARPVGFWKKEYSSMVGAENDVSGYVSVIGEFKNSLDDVFNYRKFLKMVKGRNPKLDKIHYVHFIVEIDALDPLYVGKSGLVVDIKSDKFSEATARGINAFSRRKDKGNDNVQILLEVDDFERYFEIQGLREVA